MRRILWLAVELFVAVAGIDDIMAYRERLEVLLLQDGPLSREVRYTGQ